MTSFDLVIFLLVCYVALGLGARHYFKLDAISNESALLIYSIWAFFWVVLVYLLNRFDLISDGHSLMLVLAFVFPVVASHFHDKKAEKDVENEEISLQERIKELLGKNRK